MFLGVDGDTWELFSSIGLGLSVLAAFIALLSFHGMTKIAKAEAEEKAAELERYKANADARIAEANARAEEARLALARFKSPRFVDSHIGSDFVRAIEKHRGMRVDVITDLASHAQDAAELSFHFHLAFHTAGWRFKEFRVFPSGGIVGATGVGVEYMYGNDIARDAAETVRAALLEAGLDVSEDRSVFSGNAPPGQLLGATWDALDVAPLRIYIRRKP